MTELDQLRARAKAAEAGINDVRAEWIKLNQECNQLTGKLETARKALLEARDHLHTKQDMDRCREMAKAALAQIGAEVKK